MAKSPDRSCNTGCQDEPEQLGVVQARGVPGQAETEGPLGVSTNARAAALRSTYRRTLPKARAKQSEKTSVVSALAGQADLDIRTTPATMRNVSVDGDYAGDQTLRGVSAGEQEGKSTERSGLERPIREDVRSTESRIAEIESDEL